MRKTLIYNTIDIVEGHLIQNYRSPFFCFERYKSECQLPLNRWCFPKINRK
jgi:hypothetical protein